MAQVILPKYSEGPVNAGEKRLVDFLKKSLPDDYYVIPNGEYAFKNPKGVIQFWEYDCIVVAPHAIYHIENKDWNGELIGDDNSWFVNSAERRNPHKTASYKTRLLASKLAVKNPSWRKARIITLVTLSYPGQSVLGIDPESACYQQTFTLTTSLTNFIKDSDLIEKDPDEIAEYQKDIVDFLVGTSAERSNEQRTKVHGYMIDEILQSNEDFTEYLCHKATFNDKYFKVREYPLDRAGKTQAELDTLSKRAQNADFAQQQIPASPFIIKSSCSINDEETFFYEVSEYMDDCTLKAMLRKKTFTQLEKIKIIDDIAHALKAAHSVPVYHRNVTPENIFILNDGNAALGNFGKAWFIEHENLQFTVASTVTGSESPYLAPEFLEENVCAASDLFSLGVIVYEIMVGRPPFRDTLEFKMMMSGEIPEAMMPSKVVADLPTWVDEIIRHTVVEDVESRWQTADDMIEFLAHNAFKTEYHPGDEAPQLNLKDMKPGDKITSALVLYQELGHGAFGRVFKAKNTIVNKDYAVKIFDRNASAIEDTKNEFLALSKIDHPNVVKITNCDISLQGLFYTQMELLEGENLSDYTKGDLKLPIDEIYKMATSILGALVTMQNMDPPLFHRDIKPNNIVWDKRLRYVLIDFNISTSTEDSSFAGTIPYMAPDLVQNSKKINWDCSADTFSLGVTLYELLTHAYPWPGTDPCPKLNAPANDIKLYRDDLTPEFAEFITKSIITDKNLRFRTAAEMLAALETIGKDGLLKKSDEPEDIGIDTTTDIVDYINSLYSQSSHGNSGTRSASVPSVFDKLTYTKTKLDTKLLSDIQALKYKLIIITGNAGDGKTAFIHQVENIGTNKVNFSNKNGSRFEINGVSFESNYDGSQDEEERLNSQVLEDFFAPFMNQTDYTDLVAGRIIAINEGRLVDFLSTQPGLKNLHDNIEEYFYQEGHVSLIPGLMVINLNLRSVTARSENNESLLHSQIKKLTNPELWKKCKNCPIADKCFIKFNVNTLQDGSAGDEVINRLEWLLRTLVYKKELHITMRDLRSFIAYMLTRDYTCEQVKQMILHIEADGYAPEFYWQFYYFNVSAENDFYKVNSYFPFPRNVSNDRIVKMLKETDIAKVALPSYDRDLYYKEKRSEDYLIFSDRERSLLGEFNERNEIAPAWEIAGDKLFLLKERHHSFIRHQYFEGKFDFKRRLPYQSIEDFYKYLNSEKTENMEKVKSYIAQAISKSEGCMNDELASRFLLLSCSHVNDPMSKSYRIFDVEGFELFVNHTTSLTEYIEYESDSFTFRSKEDKHIQLTVSLDLFEMLDYIGKGFSPSINDLQGRFIELQIFKNLLESKTYKEILVTKNNKKFFVIRLNGDNTISIEPYQSVSHDN